MTRRTYYYSATGNSRFICSLLPETELYEMRSTEDIPEDTEVLGLVFPTYGFNLPIIVDSFIRDVIATRDNTNLKYIFAIITNGGLPLFVKNHLSRALADAGCVLSYVRTIRMPDCYLPLKKKAPDMVERDEAVRKAREKMAIYSKEIEKEEFHLAGNGLLYRIFRGTGKMMMPLHKEERLTISDKCNLCGKCALNCPTGNIIISKENGKAVHGDRCISCFACYHFCPEEAVMYPKAKGHYKMIEIGEKKEVQSEF